MLIIYFFILLLLIIFLVIFIIIFSLNFLDKLTADAYFVSVPNFIKKDLVQNFQFTENSIFYDLGCGDGRILVEAINLNPKIKAVGVELSLIPYILAKFSTRKYRQIKILRENFYKIDISDATHIFIYLRPDTVNKLIHIIKKQCKPGTVVISCDFEITSITPIKIIDLDNQRSKIVNKLFIYKL